MTSKLITFCLGYSVLQIRHDKGDQYQSWPRDLLSFKKNLIISLADSSVHIQRYKYWISYKDEMSKVIFKCLTVKIIV
jgi:hypothetical protein